MRPGWSNYHKSLPQASCTSLVSYRGFEGLICYIPQLSPVQSGSQLALWNLEAAQVSGGAGLLRNVPEAKSWTLGLAQAVLPNQSSPRSLVLLHYLGGRGGRGEEGQMHLSGLSHSVPGLGETRSTNSGLWHPDSRPTLSLA